MTEPVHTAKAELNALRAAWMSTLAQAEPSALEAAFAALGPAPAHDWLRAPERGTAMVRGRAGGAGAPATLGEMSVHAPPPRRRPLGPRRGFPPSLRIPPAHHQRPHAPPALLRLPARDGVG